MTGECAECNGKKLTVRRASRTPELGTRNSNDVPPIVHEVLRSPGQPLNVKTLTFMEPCFGHDFSQVRVHTNQQQTDVRPSKFRVQQLNGGVESLEVGHTDCDWNRVVAEDEVFKPRSPDPVSKVTTTDECIKPCTTEHEETHKRQLGLVCKSYYDCFKEAPKKAAASPDCKGFKGPDLEKCIALQTTLSRYQCFIDVGNAWQAEKWECDAYRTSVTCAKKLQEKGDKSCTGKLGAYIYSAQKQIEKYCPKPEAKPKAEEKPSSER